MSGDDGIRGVRDRAVLLLGFAGALRRSEITGLDVEDIAWDADGIALKLRRTKEGQHSAAAVVRIPFGQNEATCPVAALRKWLDVAAIVTGPVFRRISTAFNVATERLNSDAVRRIVQSRAAAAGLVGTIENPISSHGLRAGFITSAYKVGLSDVEIMEHVRHKRPEVMRGYVRRPRLDSISPVLKVGM